MRSRWSVVLILAVLLSCLAPVFAADPGKTEDVPLLSDWSELGLKVSGIEDVPSISVKSGSKTTTTSANPGFRLLVVTLRGTVPSACRIPTRPGEFTALCTKPSPDSPGGVSYVAYHSSGIARDFTWTFAEAKTVVTTTWTYAESKPAPILLRVSFTLPDQVTGFVLRGPGVNSTPIRVPPE